MGAITINCGHNPRQATTCEQCRAFEAHPLYREMAPLLERQTARPVQARGCRHLGEPTGELVDCPPCRGKTRLKVSACAKHGRCLPCNTAPGIQSCLGCHSVRAVDGGGWLLDGVRDPLPDAPLDPVPPGWACWPEVRDRHISAFRRLLTLDFPPAIRAEGEGILFVGGGRYWPMLTVAVRMCRDVTALPIQIWHRGDDEPVDPAGIAGVPDVTIHSTLDVVPAPRIQGGWQSKTTALLHCGWQRVIYLDADAYLVGDPRPWLDMATPATPFVFWEDLPGHTNDNVKWSWFGMSKVQGEQIPPIQGGQLAIDLVAFRRELVLAHWLNQHSDYSYTHQYGDQDSWRVALAATATA